VEFATNSEVEFVTHLYMGWASCLIYSWCFLQARAPLLPCSHCSCTLICRAVCCSLLQSVAVRCCVLQCVGVCTLICRARASFIRDKSHSYAGCVSHSLQSQTYLRFLASISNAITFFLEFYDLFICGVRGFMRFVYEVCDTFINMLGASCKQKRHDAFFRNFRDSCMCAVRDH